MADKDDKAKKLEEIQKRLAEIQGKTNTPKSVPLNKDSDEPIKKAETPKSDPRPETPKAEEKPSPKPETPVKPSNPSPAKSESAQNEKQVEKRKKEAKNKTQEDGNWQSNRIKDPSVKEKKATPSLNRIYTLVSLIITLAVLSYFVFVFIVEEKQEVTTTEIPEDFFEEPEEAEEMAEEAEEAFEEMEEEIEPDVQDEKPIEKSKPSKVIPEKRESKPTKPAENLAKAESVQKPAVNQKVPNGIIISYASNSQKAIAESNVRKLRSNGFSASYYYMPDKDASSPALYKVYVGPYASESEAMPDFRKVVELNDKAFILRLN